MTRWNNHRHSTDQTFAQHAIKVYICRGCNNWFERVKPSACDKCGRMDFDDFPSKGEAFTWVKLLRRQERGEIGELERQVSIDLLTVHHRTGKPVKWGRYVADFRWRDLQAEGKPMVIGEAKPGGRLTYESQLKIRCVEAMGIPVEIMS